MSSFSWGDEAGLLPQEGQSKTRPRGMRGALGRAAHGVEVTVTPQVTYPRGKEGPSVTAAFLGVLTNGKVSLGTLWGSFVFISGVNTFGATKKRG